MKPKSTFRKPVQLLLVLGLLLALLMSGAGSVRAGADPRPSRRRPRHPPPRPLLTRCGCR